MIINQSYTVLLIRLVCGNSTTANQQIRLFHSRLLLFWHVSRGPDRVKVDAARCQSQFINLLKTVVFLVLFALDISNTVCSCFSVVTVQHYTCNEKQRCLKLTAIYGPNETCLYYRKPDEQLPQCLPTSAPTTESFCVVCIKQSIVTIICPKAASQLEVEADGLELECITAVGKWNKTFTDTEDPYKCCYSNIKTTHCV